MSLPYKKYKKRPVKTPIQAMKRRAKVRIDLLNGIENRTELANKYGVEVVTITKDIQAIMLSIRKQFVEDGIYESELIQQRMVKVYAESVNGFERSQRNAEKIKTTYEIRPCIKCGSSGTIINNDGEEQQCNKCNGEKEVVVEIVTREVKGQSGDPTFLKVQLDCLKEIARLKGLYLASRRDTININIGASIPGVDLSKVSNNNILEALALLQTNKQIENKDTINVDSRKVEVE